MLKSLHSKIGVGPADGLDGIEINTVDAYQGREKDIIILSTVRTECIGFLADYRRMNVAITRARNFLWIVGNQNTLKNNEVWGELICSIKTNYKFDS